MEQIDLDWYDLFAEWQFDGALSYAERVFLGQVVANYAIPIRMGILEECGLGEVGRFGGLDTRDRVDILLELARRRSHVGPSAQAPALGTVYAGVDDEMVKGDLQERFLPLSALLPSDRFVSGEEALGSSLANRLMAMLLIRRPNTCSQFISVGKSKPLGLSEAAERHDASEIAESYSYVLDSIVNSLQEHADELWAERRHDSLEDVMREDINAMVNRQARRSRRILPLALSGTICHRLAWLCNGSYYKPGLERSKCSPEFLASQAAKLVTEVLPTTTEEDVFSWIVLGGKLEVRPASFVWEDRHTLTVRIARSASVELAQYQLGGAWETILEKRGEEMRRHPLDIAEWRGGGHITLLGGDRQATQALDFLAYEFCLLVEHDLMGRIDHRAESAPDAVIASRMEKWMRYLLVSLHLTLRMELGTVMEDEAKRCLRELSPNTKTTGWRMVTQYIDMQRRREQLYLEWWKRESKETSPSESCELPGELKGGESRSYLGW